MSVFRLRERRRVQVVTQDGQTIQGYLGGVYGSEMVLHQATYMENDPPVELGEVHVPWRNVSFWTRLTEVAS